MTKKPDLTKLAADYARHQAAAQPHLDAMEQIKAQFREQLDYGAHTAGNLNIGIARNARFNADAFVQKYPPALNPHLYKQVPDPDAIPANMKADFMKSGQARVTVK